MTLFAKVNVAANGDVTLVTSEEILGPQNPTTINPSNGFSSVEKFVDPISGLTFYNLHLQDPYVRLLQFGAVGVALATDFATVTTTALGNTVNSNTDPLVNFAFLDFAGNVMVPTGGAIPPYPSSSSILFQVTLANSTAL